MVSLFLLLSFFPQPIYLHSLNVPSCICIPYFKLDILLFKERKGQNHYGKIQRNLCTKYLEDTENTIWILFGLAAALIGGFVQGAHKM